MMKNQQHVNVKLVGGKPSSHHPLYKTWKNMRSRCNNPNHPRFDDWGGRGIKVCTQWDEFANFVADMGERPDGHTLERQDNNGDYTPANCVWAKTSEQNLNQRLRKDSLSGVKGVQLTKAGTYSVRASNGNGGQISLGTYPTIEQATRVRLSGVREKVERKNNTTRYPYVYFNKRRNCFYKKDPCTGKETHGFKTAKEAYNA